MFATSKTIINMLITKRIKTETVQTKTIHNSDFTQSGQSGISAEGVV